MFDGSSVGLVIRSVSWYLVPSTTIKYWLNSHVGLLLVGLTQELLHIFLSVLVLVDIGASVQRRPLGVLLEQSHGMDILWSSAFLGCSRVLLLTYVALVSSEAVVNARR